MDGVVPTDLPPIAIGAMDEMAAIEEVSYPATTTEIAAACADQTVMLPNGRVRLADVFERVGVTVCSGPEDARDLFEMAVGAEAIGRKGYTDRDPPMPGVDREMVSL